MPSARARRARTPAWRASSSATRTSGAPTTVPLAEPALRASADPAEHRAARHHARGASGRETQSPSNGVRMASRSEGSGRCARARPRGSRSARSASGEVRGHQHPELIGLGLAALGLFLASLLLARLGGRHRRRGDRGGAPGCRRQRCVRRADRADGRRLAHALSQRARRGAAVPHRPRARDRRPDDHARLRPRRRGRRPARRRPREAPRHDRLAHRRRDGARRRRAAPHRRLRRRDPAPLGWRRAPRLERGPAAGRAPARRRSLCSRNTSRCAAPRHEPPVDVVHDYPGRRLRGSLAAATARRRAGRGHPEHALRAPARAGRVRPARPLGAEGVAAAGRQRRARRTRRRPRRSCRRSRTSASRRRSSARSPARA